MNPWRPPFGALLLLVVATLLSVCNASLGDRTLIYQRCVQWYRVQNCTQDGRDNFLPNNPPPLSLRITRWSCSDNCKYRCMWITIQAFKDDGLAVPQFHGKWPFLRWYGMQEPASAIFSFLNFAANLIMIIVFVQRVPSTNPLYGAWISYSALVLNAWLSSTIFHIKDTPLTEKMDYFGALAYLLCSLYAFCTRYFHESGRNYLLKLIAFAMAMFFICHVSYLSFVKFNYSYNLMVNIGIGVLNSVAWMIWCIPRRRQYPHNWKAIFVFVFLSALSSLEVLDFPPVWWVLDAHALWHAGTVLLAIPWYWFIMEDCQLLTKEYQAELMMRKKV